MNQNPLPVRAGAGRVFLCLACATAAFTTRGHGFAEFSGGVLRLNGIAEITSDSNVFGNTSDLSDIFYTFRPELAYHREGARGTAHFDAGVAIQRYDEFSQFDSENIYANGDVNLSPNSGARLSGSLRFAFFDGTEADDFLANRVEIQRLNFSLSSAYSVGARTIARFGAGLSSYKPDARPESDSWSLRGGLGYRLRPTISAFLDYSHGETNSDAALISGNSADYATDTVSVGLDGQLGPTITGSVSVGMENYSADASDAAGDGDNVVANASLSWKARVNTTVTLAAGKENRIATTAESIDATNVKFDVEQRLGAALLATASVLWETYEIRGLSNTTDDRLVFSLDLVYSLRQELGFGGGVHHNIHYSFEPTRDISRTTLNVFGRYSF